MPSLFIKNGQLVTEKGLERVDILIEDGMIKRLDPANKQTSKPVNLSPQTELIDASGLLIFPGLIDCHVHFREPGNTDAEDMESGALAAWSGGVTTVCEMPNTQPPTCTVKALENKIARAAEIRGPAFAKPACRTGRATAGRQRSEISNVDIRFFFGVTQKEHLEELKKVQREDTCGVKLYFGHSTGNQKVEAGITEEVFRVCAERGLPLVCHCEDEEIIQKNVENSRRGVARYAPTDMRMHSEIRSVEAAVKATTYAIALARKFGTHLHIAHLSTKEELELVRQAKDEGLPVTCEVAPHHLFLTVDDYRTLGTLAKMNPPLRTLDHAEALWKGISDGTVDCIATDHAPHTLAAKNAGNPLEAPSGVPGVETMLPLLLSCLQGGPAGRHSVAPLQPTDLLRLLFTRPNEIFHLGKAGIATGKPANLVLVNPLAKWVLKGKNLHSKCMWTPYEGWEVTGKVERVIQSS